jgi:hypothetical protein
LSLSFGGAVFASYAAIYLPDLRARTGFVVSPSRSETVVQTSASVALVAGRPANPHFWLVNEGNAAAQQPKYGFVIYDLDEDDTEQPRRILHVPHHRFDDYILPKRALGPWRILDLSHRAREVPPGHRVFGYVTTQCLNCRDLRTYWLYFANGRSGWFRELTASEAAVANPTLAKVIYARERAVEAVDEFIPMDGRVPFE